MERYYLYILKSIASQTYYTGSSDDPLRRLEYHNHHSKGYTKRYRPWELKFTHLFDSKELAQKAERIIKAWKSKKMIELLINGKISIIDFL
jgi:putative endonuclease